MSKFTLNGVDFEFNAMNEKVMENYENALTTLEAAANKGFAAKDASGKIREVCSAVRDFFTELLTEETSKAICGEENDLEVCYRAQQEFVLMVEKELTVRAKALVPKPAPKNRAQRRANGKK